MTLEQTLATTIRNANELAAALRGTQAPALEHGTYHAYHKRHCRCDECRAANAAYMRAWWARKNAA